jgi:serine/threonine-protein kinase
MSIAALAPGSIFAGRYVVERPLGGGGMGSVFVAQHTATRRRVALKLMRPDLVTEAGMRDRFAQEAQVSSVIRSKHVVEVLDAGVDAATGAPFLAMELLEGRDLGQLLRERGPLPADEAVRLLTQVARGLDKAHAAGVVHRDLKPENLFLCRDEDGSPLVKILDFGLAKFLQGSNAATTLAAGTPRYMAPEQLGQAPVTPAVDVWAFGLIAFTLLAGQTYWDVDSIAQLYGALLAPSYPSPSGRARAFGVALPPNFEPWFTRCTAREPAHRFATTGEAVEQLRLALGVAPITAMGGSMPAPYAPAAAGTPGQLPSAAGNYAMPPTHAAAASAPGPYWSPPPQPGPAGYGAPPPPPPPPYPTAITPKSGGSGLVVAIVAIALGVFALGGVAAFVALRSSPSASVVEKDDEKPKKKSTKTVKESTTDDDDEKPKTPSKKKLTGETVEAESEHFTATFPEGYPAPKKQTQPLPSVPGVDLVMWTSETHLGACLIGYIDYKSPSVFAGRTTKVAFDGARDGALANMGATLEDERDFEYQGYPARVFTFKGFTMGRQIYGRQLLILESYHLYQVMFIGYTKGERDTEDIKAFFDALEIKP